LRVINNGIDLKRFKGIKKPIRKKIRFGYIGRVAPHKGIEVLLKAVTLLKEKGLTGFSLVIAGTGEGLYLEYIKKVINEDKLNNFVHFLKEVKNQEIAKLYRQIDILIVPSVWPENSPVTIMEALASGTPVMASMIGGIPELVKDKVNGYLHKHNDPVSLSGNMSYLIKNPHIAKAMRDACLEKVKGLSLKNQVKVIVNEYNKLIWK